MTQRNNRTAALSKAANAMQGGQARALDDLAEYESFREAFAPEIRRALAAGMTGEAIIAKFKPMAMARLAQIGIAGEAKIAVGAIRELLDRTDGKPAAKVEHTHKLARLSDEELDALVESQTKALEAIEASAISVTEVMDDEEEETQEP